jgi:Zn-dependent metalloprotease
VSSVTFRKSFAGRGSVSPSRRNISLPEAKSVVKLLKQGVCLALIGAGLAAAPATVASQASATPTSAAQATDPSLVQQIRSTAQGQVAISNQRATGAVGFARAASGGDLMPDVNGSGKAAAAAKADQYLASYGGAFGAGQNQLTRTGITSDSVGGWTASYSQSYQGVPVFGALLRAHVDASGALTSVNGYAAPNINVSTTPRLSTANAAARAVALVRTSPAMARNGGTVQAKSLQVVNNNLMVYREGVTKGEAGANHLAYVNEVRDGHAVREMVIIDAQSGKLLNRWSMLDNDLDRRLYETSFDPTDPDTNLVWKEGDPLPGTLNVDQLDEVVTSGESYWFFKDTFDRDSYDGNGATRITVNNDPTIACPNANWNGITTNYCTGVSSDDVVAHEWGHAYTEFTSGLIYQWQSGALNESYSDVWGETLDLINNRDDEGEGDLDNKRHVGVCSAFTRTAVELFVDTPASIGSCPGLPAAFGPVISATGFTDDIVVATDDANATGPSTTDACTPLTNAGAVSGSFAYVDRGTCTFQVKVTNVQNAGATGIIVGTNANPLTQMSGNASIPGLMITQAKGVEIKAAAAAGPVHGTMRSTDTSPKDSSFRWLVSEKATAFGGAIRDMWNPGCYGDPGKVSDVQYVCDTGDQGGVHSNSGVPNHAYALLVDGGTYNGTSVTGIGLTKAAHIWYQAQTNYLTPVSNFSDMADAIEASCADLVGKQLTALRFGPNEHDTFFSRITADDCTQVHNVTTAVQFRTPAVQCNFGPMLDPNTPSPCGPGTGLHTTFSEDFEGDVTAWDTSAFDVAFTGGLHQPWTFSRDLPPGNLPPGDTRAAFGPAPDKGVCNGGAGDFSSVDYLTSPDITVGSASDIANTGRLSFDHSVETEIGFDGGLVQITKDGGTTWTNVPASAYEFNEPTVLATEAEGSTNPLAGEDGFTGTDGGKTQSDWGTSIIDLSDPALAVANGSTIKVRFAIGRDGCGGVIGWYVDNIKVGACKTLAIATVAATHVPEPSTFGSASSINVTVSGGSGTPTGSVTVKEGSTTLGTGTLSGGSASVALPASLPAGSHALSVVYSGDGNYDTKTQSVTATVNKAPSTTTASAPRHVKAKKKFNVRATVAAAGGTPTGTVQVFDGSKLIGTGTLANGTVTITITNGLKKEGKHTLTVKYLGSANVAPSQDTVKVKVKDNGNKHRH